MVKTKALAQLSDEVVLTEARYVDGHRIAFTFSDEHRNVVDFWPFLSRPNQNPMVKKYMDVEKFKVFEVVHDTDISWNDYEMCFEMEDLYHGTI